MTDERNNLEKRIDAFNDLCAVAEAWLDIDSDTISEFLEAARLAYQSTARDKGRALDPHWLYRLYDDNDRLLYVGITKNLPARISAHRRRFGDIFASYDTEQYPDRESVLAAEARAIETEYPAFNVEHPPALVG